MSERKRKVYIICPIRKATKKMKERLREYKQELLNDGYDVFLPFEDNPYEGNDPTGADIVTTNLQAIRDADEVHVAWDYTSEGSIFDLGAAMALQKTIKLADNTFFKGENTDEASITKVLVLYVLNNLKEVIYAKHFTR